MYNVVVDKADTATQLVDHGRLQRRVTIIPLSEIHPNVLQDNVIRKAQDRVGKDNAILALSLLVPGNTDIRAAIEFAFGSTIVCTSMDHAKLVVRGSFYYFFRASFQFLNRYGLGG